MVGGIKVALHITEARPSGTTSPPASFVIRTDNGTEMIRHKSYLKWDVTQQDLDLAAAEETLSASNLNGPKPVGVTAPAAVPTFDRARLRERKPRE